MRIAILAPLVSAIREPNTGGAQAFLGDLAAGLAQRGHEVHLYAASGSQVPGVCVIDTGVDPSELKATVYRAGREAPDDPAHDAPDDPANDAPDDPANDAPHDPARESPDVSSAAVAAFSGVYAAIRRGRYDVLHNHAFDAPAIRLAAGLDAAIVHTLHLPPSRPVVSAVRDVVSGVGPPTIACVSESQAFVWRRIVPVQAILPPFVPTASIPFSPIAAGGAVFAGRYSPEKGAAEAARIALAAGVPIGLFGDRYDPDYVRRRIDPLRSAPGVSISSALPRRALWAAIGRASVIVCPAAWDEPFGMVAAEAQACGTPVVAFRRGALAEVVVDGVTGLLVAPGDIDGAADAVRRAPALDRRRCREHAESELDLQRSIDAHERLYERVAVAGVGVRPGG